MDSLSRVFQSLAQGKVGSLLTEGGQIRTVLLILGLFMAGVSLLYIRSNADAATGPARALTVDTSQVVFEDAYNVEQRFAGRVEAQRETRLAFERAGLVTKVSVEEGDRVSQGQVIATMDVEPLISQKTRLEADRTQVLAQLELARLTTERQKKLSKDGFSSIQRYDDARLSVAAFEASVASINAAIQSVDIDLEKSVLVAPYDGVVGAVLVDDGAVINAGTGVADVLDSRAIQARIGLPPKVAAVLEVGAMVRLAYADQEYQARLVAVRSDLDARTQTIAALFELSPSIAIPYGEVVHFLHEQVTQARGTWLPLSALVEGEKGLWSVYVAKDEDGVRRIGRESVEIIHTEGGQVYVRGTLAPAARVLVGGTNRVAPGQRVALAE